MQIACSSASSRSCYKCFKRSLKSHSPSALCELSVEGGWQHGQKRVQQIVTLSFSIVSCE